MSYLRNKDTAQVIGPLTDDSAEYLYLQGKRSSSDQRPLWEDVGTQEAQVAGVQYVATIQALADAIAAAASATFAVGRAPFNGIVTAVNYIPAGAINGVATNNRTFNAINGGQAGAGSTNIASLNMGAGVNIASEAIGVITLNATPANLNVNQGDEIQFQSASVGTGIADPGGLVLVTFAREA